VIVDPEPTDTPPADAAEFMNSVGSWANQETGLNNIDLWVGGLAERTNLFGGLLGSTFNYVFENQLTDLQNSDRLYYLGRTPGMNLRSQLEGNSFAELVMRNTNAHTLKADAFGTADCKFQLSNLQGTAAGFATLGNQVADDPSSECDERALLIRMADGTIRYRTANSVDPPGINGQSVYNGTSLVDRIWGGVDNDTFLGNEGNDIVEGNDGADVALGGEGNDKITDSAGADVLKGGPGNDAIESGPGLDVIMGGDGNDFTNGGANANETFGGTGNDFMILGQGLDGGIGDSGDDWIEGGDQPDGLRGDSASLFFTDPNTPGNDVLIGQAGDDDYDSEGGDDIMVAGGGVEKNIGSAGYDFSTGFMDPQPQDADLRRLVVPDDPLLAEVRDRFDEVEALSGGPFDDKLRGDDIVPVQVTGAGAIGCDALDQAGLDRIAGLDALVPPLNTPTADVVANSSSMNCPLTGPFVWGDGNILVGGAGSDLIEGRGADDIIDGDAYLSARLSVRNDAGDPATEIGSASLMENRYLRDGAGNLVGPTLQQAVFAGTVDPGNIVIAREILSSPNAADVDTALFSDVLANYDITANANGSTTVNHARGTVTDGIDTLWNIERGQFADVTVDLGAPAAPGIGTATDNGNFTPTVRWTAPAGNLFFPITSYLVQPTDAAGNPVGAARTAGPNATSLVVNGLTGGTTYRFKVAAVNAVGTGAYSALSNSVTITGDSTPPTVAAQSPAQGQVNVAPGANVTATFSENVQGVSGGILGIGANFQLRRVAPPNNNIQAAVVSYNAATLTATLNPVLNLANGVYRVTLADPDGAGPLLPIRDLAGNPLATTTWTFRVGPGAPPAPLIGTATRGAAGGVATATIRWSAPAGARDAEITGYQVTALRMKSRAANAGVLRRIVAPVSPASARAKVMTLPAGIYRFTVVALNADGKSSAAGRSNLVTPR
jgi:Ca2+-binding RTX toxin-like protein